MSQNHGLYRNSVYMLAERFFIQDEGEILKSHAHKYNFDILFFSKMESYIFAMLGANEDDLFVVDLDVLHNHQTGQTDKSMFLRDLQIGRAHV